MTMLEGLRGSSPSTGTLGPGGWARYLGIAGIAALSFAAGASMDISILVVALGLCNMAVLVFLLLRRDITWGFLFYLTSVIFFQTGFWIRLPGFPDLYPARVVSILLYLVFLMQIVLGMRRAPKFGRVEYMMIIFLVILHISVLTSGQQPRWMLLMRGYVYPFLFYYFARAVINQEKQIKLVMGYLAVIGIYFGVMGIFEKIGWYEFVFPKFIVDPTVRAEGLMRLGFRVRGIFLQPAILGCVMTMGFFAAWYSLSRMRGMIPQITRLVLLLVTPPTIFFTQTRSVYAGFLGALIVGAIWSRMLRPICVGIILAGMVGAFLNWENMGSEDRDKGGLATMNTVHYRVVLLYEGAEVFLDHPFFGCGFMNFNEMALEYRKPRDVPFFGHIDLGTGGVAVPHNIFFTVIAEQGLLGIVPYFLIYFFMWRISIKAFRALPREGTVSRDFVVCVWCAIAGYFINAMFLEMRYFEYVNVLFFFLIGSLVGMYERYQASMAPEPAAAAGPARHRFLMPSPVPKPVTGFEGRA
jgi:O-antigen ligase